jgi:3-deoxy-manno-octulosonate cytidylyltransferase (CMP-KDO synthetase)
MTHENHQSGTDRIAEAAETINLADRDIVVNIQGDQPIFQPSMLSDLIQALITNPTTPMSTLMHKIVDDQELHDTNNVKVAVDNNGYALYLKNQKRLFIISTWGCMRIEKNSYWHSQNFPMAY